MRPSIKDPSASLRMTNKKDMDTNKKNDIFDDVKETLRERLTSPFYGTLIISWCLWNWEIFYVTFFVDSQLLYQSSSLLKNDYIHSLYSWNLYLPAIWTILRIFVLAPISSYLIVFKMPWVTERFYKKSLETDNKQKSLKDEAEKKLFEMIGQRLEAEKKVIKEEQEIKVIKEQSISRKERWDKEFEDLRRTRYKDFLSQLSNLVYSFNGDIDFYKGKNSDFQEFAPYFDSIGIITIDSKNMSVSLTDKGKYFLKKELDSKY